MQNKVNACILFKTPVSVLYFHPFFPLYVSMGQITHSSRFSSNRFFHLWWIWYSHFWLKINSPAELLTSPPLSFRQLYSLISFKNLTWKTNPQVIVLSGARVAPQELATPTSTAPPHHHLWKQLTLGAYLLFAAAWLVSESSPQQRC